MDQLLVGLNRGIVVRGKTNKVLRLLLTLSIVVFFNIGSISILGQYLTRSKVNIGLTSFFYNDPPLEMCKQRVFFAGKQRYLR